MTIYFVTGEGFEPSISLWDILAYETSELGHYSIPRYICFYRQTLKLFWWKFLIHDIEMISFISVRDNPKNYTLKLRTCKRIISLFCGLQRLRSVYFTWVTVMFLTKRPSRPNVRSIGESNPNPVIDSHIY